MKKTYRSDNTYMIRTESTDNPKLGAKLLADGRESLFLDFNYGYSMAISSVSGKIYPKKHRRREYLRLYLYPCPKDKQQRRRNRETLALAKKLRFELEQQLLECDSGYRLHMAHDINFLDWMNSYYESYTKGDKRHIKRARTCFIDFLASTPEFAQFSHSIRPAQISPRMVVAFTEYLNRKFVGEGPHTLFARFKKIVKAAVEANVMKKNPCAGVTIKTDCATLKKDVLSMEEIRKLNETHFQAENTDIRRAFIFSCYTGLRWCDVKELTFSNIDISNRLLKFEQAKTKGHSKASGVVIPLNDALLSLIGVPPDSSEKESHIFNLPSHPRCLRELRHWVTQAGINKHITWHCARHSFAVNILNNGANIKTLASLLGHSGLKHTEKYTRATDTLKQAAIDSLPGKTQA